MKKAAIITFVAVIGLVLASFQSTNNEVNNTNEKLTWYTDLDEAYEVSKESGKPIFGFFTGSDWCGWCHKLEREVFAKDAFVEWAEKEVVLLELDFPRKTKLPEEQAKQNRELQQAFRVTGYPTIWIFFADKDPETAHYSLTALGKLGYPSGAVKGKEEVKFLENANNVLANKDKK